LRPAWATKRKSSSWPGIHSETLSQKQKEKSKLKINEIENEQTTGKIKMDFIKINKLVKLS
jgi:hypothetical protein